MATETKARDVFKEIGKYPDSPCHLCGRPGTHYFPDSSGAWVCEDAPHCKEIVEAQKLIDDTLPAPEPDSVEYWRAVAQGLAMQVFEYKQTAYRLESTIRLLRAETK